MKKRSITQRDIRGMKDLMKNTSNTSVAGNKPTDAWSVHKSNKTLTTVNGGKKKSFQKNLWKNYEVNSALYTPIDEHSMKCPYCSAKMILKNQAELGKKYKEEEVFVCEKYPACDTYCRTTISDYAKTRGQRVLLSTPANARLRNLRTMAHHYFGAVMDTGIYASSMELYLDLGHLIKSFNGTPRHIGECQDYGCICIINECIRILYNHRDKISKFRLWKGDEDVLTDESKKMVKELSCMTKNTSRKDRLVENNHQTVQGE